MSKGCCCDGPLLDCQCREGLDYGVVASKTTSLSDMSWNFSQYMNVPGVATPCHCQTKRRWRLIDKNTCEVKRSGEITCDGELIDNNENQIYVTDVAFNQEMEIQITCGDGNGWHSPTCPIPGGTGVDGGTNNCCPNNNLPSVLFITSSESFLGEYGANVDDDHECNPEIDGTLDFDGCGIDGGCSWSGEITICGCVTTDVRLECEFGNTRLYIVRPASGISAAPCETDPPSPQCCASLPLNADNPSCQCILISDIGNFPTPEFGRIEGSSDNDFQPCSVEGKFYGYMKSITCFGGFGTTFGPFSCPCCELHGFNNFVECGPNIFCPAPSIVYIPLRVYS